MFEGPETFVIGNDSRKRCNIHIEDKFVLAKEMKVTKNFKCVVAVLKVSKVLTIGASEITPPSRTSTYTQLHCIYSHISPSQPHS